MSYHYYFPQEWIELQKEVSYHEEAILAVMMATDYVQNNPFEQSLQMSDFLTAFLVKLAAVCAYCGIVVDGYYDERQINELCVRCTDILRSKRKEWRVGHDE